MKSNVKITTFSQLENGNTVQYIAISLRGGKTSHRLRVTSIEYESGGEPDVILEIVPTPGDKRPADLIPISAREIIIRPL